MRGCFFKNKNNKKTMKKKRKETYRRKRVDASIHLKKPNYFFKIEDLGKLEILLLNIK